MESLTMNYSQSANPNATNSELDAKRIITHKQLTSAQQNELIDQYVDLCVDSMDYKSLEEFVRNTLIDDFNKLSQIELKDEIRYSFDEETLNDLVDSVQDVTVLDINDTGGKY